MTLRLADDREKPRSPRDKWTKAVHHGGRNFVATDAMASIFESKANDAIARGETELVPLLHRGGVDLLLITPQTRFTVVNIELGVSAVRMRHMVAPKRELPAS